MKYYFTILMLLMLFTKKALSQSFVHPGGLHTQADLERMKTKVAEGIHPWIEGWKSLTQDPLAQSDYKPAPKENMNLRQVMSRDAHAAYLNAIRWYISGDDSYGDCAIRILNAYSYTLNQIPSGGSTDIVGLGGIGISELAMAAEVMRINERWKVKDFEKFKSMMVNYLYPVCYDFLTNHNGACIDYYWANWDANNIVALIAIGVLCDNQKIFDEGIEYFKNGAGTGSIKHAVYYLHNDKLGQWQESGRDQEHAQLGVGLLGTVCQIAWNQGIDLFGYDNNRLLAGAEYVAKYNQMQEVPFTFYDNCQPSNHKWPAINGRGRLDDRPVWEMLYNHYKVRQGVDAPNVQRMAELMRPERGSKDHFGYGTLTFTLEEEESHYPPHPIPSVPTDLIASAGTGSVFLTWQPPSGFTTTGYVIQRASGNDADFEIIDSWDDNTYTVYTDHNVSNGTKYKYRVAAINQSGLGSYSSISSATPVEKGSLPTEWNRVEIGDHHEGSAQFADASDGTYVVKGYGTAIDNISDNVTFVYKAATDKSSITVRMSQIRGKLEKTGIMIRESLDDNAKTVTLTLGEGGGRFARMGYRVATGAKMYSTLGNTYTWQPAWFRITRTDEAFTAYESSDGVTWYEVASVNIDMASSYYVGLMVCSGDANKPNTTIFDHVTVTKLQ